jgi:tetratricopeptide (TPR) repeat protein
MSLEVWLNLIRQRFSPTEGQILIQSLQQDPLVWQFVQDEETSLPYFKDAPNDLSAYAPGKIAAWLIEQSAEISLSGLGEDDFSLPSQIKSRAAQAFETTFNTGLPPSDLYTAGLLALTLRERRVIKKTWQGISEEIFIHKNHVSYQKHYRIWRTPFTCLFNFCPDFNDLMADFLGSKRNTIIKPTIPIYIHSLLSNPMDPGQLIDQIFSFMKNLSIDMQLEGLGWIRQFRQTEMQIQIAKYLMQTKSNIDFFKRVFSDLEAFDTVNPSIDPLEKQVMYRLPEDTNRLAAFYYFSGNCQKAMETYEKSGDLLEFLKAQTLYQTLAADHHPISSSRWLEIIKSVPHSKQARLFYAKSLIDEGKETEALHQLDELPLTVEKQFLQERIQSSDKPTLEWLAKGITPEKFGRNEHTFKRQGYYVHQAQLDIQRDILNDLTRLGDQESVQMWLEAYVQENPADLQAVKLASELFEKENQINKAIELTSYLERVEPTEIVHKRSLARLYTQVERWQEAFAFLQDLIKSEPSPEIEDLERFAEATLRTDHIEMAMSICHNILKRDARNTKALVLLGEGYLQKGDVLKAIQHMEGVVELIPEAPDAWLTLAYLWQKNDQTDRALETLKRGANTLPQQPALLRALGKAHLEAQVPAEALPILERAHLIEPNNIEGKLDLAHAKYQLNRFQEAYQLLESFTHNHEEIPDAARLLGHVLISLNQHRSAEPILLSAADHFPEDLKTVLTTSHLVLDNIDASQDTLPQNILEKLEGVLKKSLTFYPEHQQIKRSLADIDRLRGNYQKAFDIYSHLTKTSESEKLVSDWRLKYGMGQAAIGLGNQDVGLASLQAAANIQPSNLIVRHALADALQTVNLPGKANEMAQFALKLAPQDLDNILWYAKFKTKTNQPSEAVRALKEALQITPNRDELKIWLAKALITTGALDEAQEIIKGFVFSAEPNAKLLQQAAYVCVHLNDLSLASQALEKALSNATAFDPNLLMDIAVTYALQDEHKKALDTLDIDPRLMIEHPQIGILKADLLCKIGQYELAWKTIKSIETYVEQSLAHSNDTPSQVNTSPLIYTLDITLKGYFFRFGQLSRALRKFNDANDHFKSALEIDPSDIAVINAALESAMVGFEFDHALEIADQVNPYKLQDEKIPHELLDIMCSRVEIYLNLNVTQQAIHEFNKSPQSSEPYSRNLAVQSRLASATGEIEKAKELLKEALQSYQEQLAALQSQTLSNIFRKIINLHSIAEASLSLGDYAQAIQLWQQIYSMLATQPLMNKRYLDALILGAESQQIADTLAIKAHSPGKDCLSEEHTKIAQNLLGELQNFVAPEETVCLKAQIVSAFTGTWPMHLNVDACLLGPSEAAAVLIGSKDENFVRDILDAYPNHPKVLQAYGVYALRNQKKDAVPYIEQALTYQTVDPVNHALLAMLNLDQPEQALQSIETALSFWPDEPEWHALAADLSASTGNSELAEHHIRLALDHQPENAAYWQKSAMINAEINDFEQAKSDLERSTSFGPDNPQTWAKMAEINQRLGDIPEAINNIRKASELAPEDDSLGDLEMQLLLEQKNFLGLETKAREILSRQDHHPSAQLYLAQALAKQGKFTPAQQILEEAMKVDPENTRLALEHIKIKKDQAGFESAIPDLITLAHNHPEDPPVLTTLTDWLIQTNRLEEAEEVAQTTLRILPEEAEVHLMLGRLQRKKGELDQAISHLSDAITLAPKLVEAYIELGKTYQERRDLEKAIEIYQKGSQANGTDPRPYYYAGLALKESKDYLNAEMMLKQAKKHSPDDANIIRQLGVVTALNLINNLREAK